MNVENIVEYKFNEAMYCKELQDYIDSTYGQHYSGKIQVNEFIMSNMDGLDYLKGQVIKYVVRLGKKDGLNRNDVLKSLHYLILMLYNIDSKSSIDIKEHDFRGITDLRP